MNGYLKLVLSCLILWFFFAFIGPTVAQKSKTLMELVRIADEKGIHTGSLYYTDVPTSYESEMAIRRAVKEGMALRKMNKEKVKMESTRPIDKEQITAKK